MLKRILIFFVLILSFSFHLVSQATFPMKDTTVAECDGIHTDSDAKVFPAGQYLANELFVFSICPGTGATINYTFTSFYTELNEDTLTFFDGPDTLSPRIGVFSGNLNATLPPTIIATSGCLTMRFRSDGVLEFPGWTAVWNTYAPVVTAPSLNVSAIEPPACDSTSFLIEFDRKIHCDSIVNSTVNFSGFNPPTVTNITKVGCVGDSSRFARIWLSTPFVYNCEYVMNMNINIPDICDSVYNFDIKDTFDFVSCKLFANLTSTYDSLCFGDCTSLEVTNATTCNTYSYAWSNGIPATAGPHNVCPLTTTTYYVTVTESNTGNQYIDSVTIKVLDTLDKELSIFTNTSEPPECNDRFFKVKFDRSIPCYFIDSGTFTLTSPARSFTITNVYPLNCTNGKIDSVRVRINPRFAQNCEYFLEFNFNFIDSCEGPISIVARDTFFITDCPFTISTSYTDSLCMNNCTNVSATASGCDGYTYTWSNGLPNTAGPFNICPTGDTTFYLSVTEISTGLILLDTITITMLDPTITAVAPMCVYDSPINLTAISSGGIWTGNGITNSTLGTFDPSVALSGTHIITYTINTCVDTVSITITDPNAGPNRNLCASGIPVNLFAATPAGGIWTGTNVNSTTSEFTPTTYGNFTAYYTVNGCIDSINIFVDTIAFTYDTDTLCGNSSAVNIPFTPTGGTWSGTGITSSSLGTFDPSMANNGSNLVDYYYKGCRDTVNMVVVTVTAGPDTNSCPSQTPFNVTAGTPLTGAWSGIGITNTALGTFNPATQVGNWMSNLVYTYQGCSDTLVMDVIQTNIVQDTLYFCPSQDSVLISSIAGLTTNPNYGTWTGNGVRTYGNDDYLYPKLLGNGFHPIFYEKNTCQDSVIIGIYPDSLSYRDTTVCNTVAPFKLDSVNNFSGATWQGTGITNSATGMFDPSLATTGVNVITYRTQGGICDKTINVTVNQYVAASINIADTFCFTNQNIPIPVTPTGGTWSGTGNYNKAAGTFNPLVAGPGRHQIYYSFGTGACFTTDEKFVVVRDSISASLVTNVDTICLGDNATLTASAIGGYPNPNYTYTWSHSATTSNSDIVSPTISTQYNVLVDDGCSETSSDTVTVTVLSINPNLIKSPPVCFGEIGYATYDLSQKSIYSFTWTKPSVFGDTIFGMGKDSAYLTISNSFGCSIDTFLVIDGYDFLQADFDINPDRFPKCLSSQDKSLIVTDKSTGATTGAWDFGDGNNLPYSPANVTETNTYADGGNYTVTLVVKNNGPCFDTLTKEICVSDQVFFIADIFSPNGDGANDIFYVRSSEAEELSFRVFDRWGKMVFESNDVEKGWDGTYKGKELESGIYFWYVTMKTVGGEELNEKGDVTLKR